MLENQGSWERWIPILEREVKQEESKAAAVSLSHGLDHLRRVWKSCRALGANLEADLEVLVAAAYLHDLGRHYCHERAHGELSAELAAPVLERIAFPEGKRDMVLHAVRVHDVTFEPADRQTIESRILYEADKIDAFGVVGVMRYIVIFHGKKPVEFILEDLEMRWKGLTLPEIRRLAKKDYDYIVDFFQRLQQALA